MNISVENIFFNYGKKVIFNDLSFDIGDNDKLPVIILGPSGCGKTTLLKLCAGLLKPDKGQILNNCIKTSMIFQEPRFLPWFNIIENIMLPLEKEFGKNESREKALYYLRLVSLENEALSFPAKLSGGQLQRASIARAFAYPSQLLLMDEPFQSLDIPLRIELMELCIELLQNDNRLVLAVTHDPREAVFLGSRIIILGQPPAGIVFDERINLSAAERSYGSPAAAEIERDIIQRLKSF